MNREEAIYFANSLKNNYTVDLNDMEAFCDMAIKALAQEPTTKNNSSELEKNSKKLEEPQTFKWCTDCREYDQEKHCCHRWSKVIRDTVEEMKQEQEPILDKIRAEILEEHENAYAREDYDTAYGLSVALDIIDKYKAESEG